MDVHRSCVANAYFLGQLAHTTAKGKPVFPQIATTNPSKVGSQWVETHTNISPYPFSNEQPPPPHTQVSYVGIPRALVNLGGEGSE